MVVTDRSENIMALSCAATHTHVRAINAILHADINSEIKVKAPDADGSYDWYRRVYRWDEGYRTSYHRLGCQTWHMVAVAKRPGLILPVSEELVWQELSSERYTTPILRSWVGPLIEWLTEHNHYRGLQSFGIRAALLACGTGVLDYAVSELLKQGKIKI